MYLVCDIGTNENISSHRLLSRAVAKCRQLISTCILWECAHCYAIYDLHLNRCPSCKTKREK